MSDTPRTDKAYADGLQALHPASEEGKFCRRLERDVIEAGTVLIELRRELAEVCSERDKLRDFLPALGEAKGPAHGYTLQREIDR